MDVLVERLMDMDKVIDDVQMDRLMEVRMDRLIIINNCNNIRTGQLIYMRFKLEV